MFEDVDFIHKNGESGLKLKLFGLTTCAYCKRAVEYLDGHGFAYDLLYLDDCSEEAKSQVKREFKERFGKRLTVPTLFLNENEYLVGFIKVAWDEMLRKDQL